MPPSPPSGPPPEFRVPAVEIRAVLDAEAGHLVLGRLVHGVGFRVMSMLAHATPSPSWKTVVAAVTAWLPLPGPA
jgi:hypothetical protein